VKRKNVQKSVTSYVNKTELYERFKIFMTFIPISSKNIVILVVLYKTKVCKD